MERAEEDGRGHAKAGGRRTGRRLALSIAVPAFLAGGGTAFVHVEPRFIAHDLDAIVAQVIEEPLPRLVRGTSGFARSGDHAIWYETIAPQGAPRGTVLLSIGIADDAFGWPLAFIDALVERGFRVIRYDHRGTGLSDWDIGATRFTLADMAADAIAVLDAVGVEEAHLVGVSMGGMIAQEFAIRHRDRAASLTSIMSTGDIFDRDLPGVSRLVQAQLFWETAKHWIRGGGERSFVHKRLAERRILTGGAPRELALREVELRALAQAALYNERLRRGTNPEATLAHMRAVGRSGSRHEALTGLDIPALVIHGTDDPLLPLAHGEKTARSIPGARSLWLEGMGHEIPDHLIEEVAEAIVAMIEP